MTIPQIIAAAWLTAGITALPIAFTLLASGARADDRTRNNAAGEVGEGARAAGHLVQRNKTNREA